jgi:hypothetical protein
MKSLTLGLIAGAALSLAAAAAETPTGTGGNGATFVNGSNHSITLYARFGGDGSCESQPKEQTVTLDPKQSLSVDSGGSAVCFCLKVPDRNTCPSGWATIKPGGTRHLL